MSKDKKSRISRNKVKGYQVLPDATNNSVLKFVNTAKNNENHKNINGPQHDSSKIKEISNAEVDIPAISQTGRQTAVCVSRKSKIPRMKSFSTDSSPLHKSMTRAKTITSVQIINRRGTSLSPSKHKSVSVSNLLSKNNSKINIPSKSADKSPMRNTISYSYKIVQKSPKAYKKKPCGSKKEEVLTEKQINNNMKRMNKNTSLKIPNLSPIEGTPIKEGNKQKINNNTDILAKIDTTLSKPVNKVNCDNNSDKKNKNNEQVKSPTRIPIRTISKTHFSNSEINSSKYFEFENMKVNGNQEKISDNKSVSPLLTSASTINIPISENNNDIDEYEKEMKSIIKNDNNNDNNNDTYKENEAIPSISETLNKDASTNTEKLVPLTRSNVISMTTAAITAQPLQVATNVTNKIVDQVEYTSEEIKVEDADVAIDNEVDSIDNSTVLYNSKTASELKMKKSLNSDEDIIKHYLTSNDVNIGEKKTNSDEQEGGMNRSQDEPLISGIEKVHLVNNIERKPSCKAIAEVKGVVQVDPSERPTVINEKVLTDASLSSMKEHRSINIDSEEITTEYFLNETSDTKLQCGDSLLCSKENALDNHE